MSEITKLYENAGIEKEVIKGCYDYYSKLGIDIWKENDCRGKNCDTCKKDKSIKEYPLFTTEKQIELIKWLGKRGLLNIIYSKDKNTYHLFNDRCIGAFCYDIATAIATLVQCELDFCSPEEKQQVKGILE